MRLTSFTDYTLRSLIYMGLNRDRLVTIGDIAAMHAISKNHLIKVIGRLVENGLVGTTRGRNGGLRLKQEPADINIGAVVRISETDFFMAECFDAERSSCAWTGNCALQHKLGEATRAYLAVLDALTLQDILPQAAPDGMAYPMLMMRRGQDPVQLS